MTDNKNGAASFSPLQRTTDNYKGIIPTIEKHGGYVKFKSPLTMGDFRKWLKNHQDEKRGNIEDIALFNSAKQFVVDTDLNLDENPPFAVVEFVIEAWGRYLKFHYATYEEFTVAFGRLLKRDPLPYRVEFKTEDYIELFPALSDYVGTVSFADVITASMYVEIVKNISPDNEKVADSFMFRMYRAGLPAINSLKLNGVDRKVITKSGEDVPLVVAAWLAHITDIYLGCQLNAGKLVRTLGGV